MLTGFIILLALLAITVAALLLRRPTPTLADRIDALLPQTQCTQCGYAGCRPYAEAVAQGRAGINQCPPGGQVAIDNLARLLDVPSQPLDPMHGEHKPRAVALIDESTCIGCTLCIQACPVDAIVGAAKLMHTVIADQCTGCELCIAPCPVDCISMVPARAERWATLTRSASRRARHARNRYRFHQFRLARDKREHPERLAQKAAARLEEVALAVDPAKQRKQAIIEAALARARTRLAQAAQTTN